MLSNISYKSSIFLLISLVLLSFASCRKEADECPWCPQVHSISPASAPYGDTVFITGKYLLPNPEYNDVLQVKFNGEPVGGEYILESYDDSIRMIIPKGVRSGPVTVDLNVGDGLIGTQSADFIYQYTPVVSTFAGNGTSGNTNSQNPLNASFSNIQDLAIDPSNGILYVRDGTLIRTISNSNGVRTLQTSSYPPGLELAGDKNGKLFFYRSDNFTMRKLNYTVEWDYDYYAGKPNISGHIDSTLSQSTFANIYDMKFDNQNNMIIGDDNFLRKINTTDSVVTTIAGTNPAGFNDGPVSSARFQNVKGIEIMPDGSIYIADENNHIIRKIKSGQVTTVAGMVGMQGSGNAPIGTNAQLQYPYSLAFDGKNKLYFIDDCCWIRVMDINTTAVTVAAGDTSNSQNCGYIDGAPYDARFSFPNKIVYDKNSNVLYISEPNNFVIRQITFE